MSEFRFESIKDGFADTAWDISDDASDSSSYRILCVFGTNDTLRGYSIGEALNQN